jgi:preprotein translocase subunit SecA
MLRIFRHIYLEELDRAWVDHLTEMDHLRDSIGLRGYGQKDPKQEYKKEGYSMFVNMVARVSSNIVTKLFSVNVKRQEEENEIEQADLARHAAQLQHAVAQHEEEPVPEPAPPPAPLIQSDQECPCGSGKPFNQCHGTEDEAVA